MSSQRTVNNASVLGCSPEHSTYTICLCTEIWQRLLVSDMRNKTPPSMGVCYMFIAIPHMSETIFKCHRNLMDILSWFNSFHKEDLTCAAFFKNFNITQIKLYEHEFLVYTVNKHSKKKIKNKNITSKFIEPKSAWIKDVCNGAVCRLDRIFKGLWQEDMAFQSISPVCRVSKIKEAKSDYFLPRSLSSTNYARVPGNDLLNHYPCTLKILITAYASSLASSP